jgi:trehalose 6-phosphate synthase
MHAHRLIIASNRGPVEFQLRHDNTLKGRRGSGGMVTALIDVGNSMDVTWVAMAMTEGDRQAVQQARQQGGLLQSPLRDQKMQLRYVLVSKSAYKKHYEKISNETLWFLQHYLYDPIQAGASARKLQDAWDNGYVVANQAIADTINAEIEREETVPVVMLQDYHLYLVPAMIRQHHPTIMIQQFIHIPWPDVRCWHYLPGNIVQAIYRGVAGNDILGFQTERDARNFLEGAKTLLEGAVVDFEEGVVWWEGHRTQARSYPISISVTQERRTVNSAAGHRAAEKMQPHLNEYNIMRVDRLEPTKNILRGFESFDLLLEKHPELHGRVNFQAFMVPSRQSLPVYRRYTADVMELIEEINKKYGTANWTPVHAFCDNDRPRALAAMQYYDVLLVNPIIDGMNLVAKEGPVVNTRDGVLVLSRTAGAFQQLAKGSIANSPLDVVETAENMYKALTLSPEERHTKATLARQAVERNDLNMWLSLQLHDINELLEKNVSHNPSAPTPTAGIVANVG